MKTTMDNIKERLAYGVEMLAKIYRRRVETGCPTLGANIESVIIERELAELEHEMCPVAVYVKRP